MKVTSNKFLNFSNEISKHYFNWTIIALLIIVVLGGYFRFFNITKIGIVGSDSFYYWGTAKKWAEGNFITTIFYRPIAYLQFAFAMKIFGYSDYVLKIFNCIMDIINILLIFYIGYLLSKNLWVGISSIVIYTFLPIAIKLSRTELVHISSGTFVLLSFLFFILYFQNSNKNRKIYYIFLALSGFSLSCAVNTHPELGLLGFAYIFYLALSYIKKVPPMNSFKNLLLDSAIFTISFGSVFFVAGLYYGISEIIKSILYMQSRHNVPVHSKMSLEFFKFFYQAFSRFISDNSSKLTYFLFLGAFLIIIKRKIMRLKDAFITYLPFILIFTYIIGYSIFTSRYILSRLFLPLLPLVIIILSLWYHKLFVLLFKRYSVLALILLSILLAYFNSANFFKSYYSLENRPSYYREIFNYLKDKVDENNKLLLTPYILYEQRRGFRSLAYFGNNAIYILDCSESLPKIIDNYKIKYLYIGKKGIDKRMLRNYYRIIGRSYGISPKEYSLYNEIKILSNFLNKRKAKLIYESDSGQVFEL